MEEPAEHRSGYRTRHLARSPLRTAGRTTMSLPDSASAGQPVPAVCAKSCSRLSRLPAVRAKGGLRLRARRGRHSSRRRSGTAGRARDPPGGCRRTRPPWTRRSGLRQLGLAEQAQNLRADIRGATGGTDARARLTLHDLFLAVTTLIIPVLRSALTLTTSSPWSANCLLICSRKVLA